MEGLIGLVVLILILVPIAVIVLMVKLSSHSGRIKELEERQQRSISRIWALEGRLATIAKDQRAAEAPQPTQAPQPCL
jgi:uncharacterized membrane protein